MAEGRVTIDVVGERKSLWEPVDENTASPTCRQITIIANEGNAGDIVVGQKDVVAAVATRVGYWPLDAGQSMTIRALSGEPDIFIPDLHADGSNADDSLRWVSWDSSRDVEATSIVV